MRTLVVGALVGLAVATGCGGDDSGAADRDTFVKAAEANCRERQQANARRRAEEPASAEPGAWLDDFEAEHAAQAKLDPPDDLRAGWQAYLRNLQTYVREERTVMDDAAQTSGEAGTASAKANRAGFLMRKAARDLGLRTCADQFA